MIELLTTAEMAEADRLAVEGGIKSIDLMESAGAAVAEAVGAAYSLQARIVIVAGPGNNAGDGFVAARILRERGYQVRILVLGDIGRLKGDAKIAAQRMRAPVEPAAPGALLPADVIVDALFGAGLDRPVNGEARAMIEKINTVGVPVIAVDLPSGINGTTGAVMGAAVEATETVTFFRRKYGHVLLPGRTHCGKVHVRDIGIPDTVLARIAPRTVVNDPSVWSKAFAVPRADGHKYSRGHAVVVSGGLASTGAARLAARGALRAGAGLVTIASPREALLVNTTASVAVMVHPVDGADELMEFLADERRNAVVLGPGGGVGAPMRHMVLAALAGERGVVLDADALTSFAEEPHALVRALRTPSQTTVLTPHEGEFHRLFKSMDDVDKASSKLEKARLAAERLSAVVLLKGADTVVAAPDGRATIADNAPPWLATAGSGDVLAGMVCGLLAQGMPGYEAAAAAVWLHGEAGKEAGPGLIAEDLPEMLPRVYFRLLSELGLI
jgi:ADP-dependent NAD(P)H-hydrate dehydratase / NAD(P)H-hydrate epimerase